MPFPTFSMRVALVLYAVLMAVLFPVVLLYIRIRARRDPRYGQHLLERFGCYPTTQENCVWIHAVSLGELRAAAPLIRALLKRGDTIVTTHFTPAGRAAALSMFPEACKSNTLIPVYVPFEFDWVFRRFFKAFTPQYGLVMEIELWPRMIASTHRHNVPLFMCNGHYPEKSFQRDDRKYGLRRQLVTGFTGMFIKSDPDAARFKAFGAKNVVMTGELRFDQAIPPHMVARAADFIDRHSAHLANRRIITLASVVEGEDPQYIEMIKALRDHYSAVGQALPLFVYVPRAPERFDKVSEMLGGSGFQVSKRSALFDAALQPSAGVSFGDTDILLGDSLGEMFFYLALADIVIVGGGFVPTGAHNIIEPLALKKTVLVGPNIWTIEFPAFEAIEAGALVSVNTIPEMVSQIQSYGDPAEMAQKQWATEMFNASHAGAVERTLAAIDSLTS